ncbi:tRNA lysidine(34) synthetase TilS [bacterium]|nr:tRNA lysidine(34) synthetase TilS [bacterium]
MTIAEALQNLPAFPRYAVAFSGGADSTALLKALCDSVGPERVAALHFEHGIRGEESLEDASFCKEFAKTLGVEFALGEAPRGLLSCPAPGMNQEELARIERYKWFARICAKLSVGCLLTAHHADDASETLLMHLFRGSGGAGIRGLRKSAKISELFPKINSDLLIWRPLIDVPGCELREYCLKFGLAFREDSTNEDTSYTRNWLRLEIVPKLKEKFGPGLPVRLRNTSRQLEDMLDLLREEAEEFLAREALLAPFGVVIDRDAFLGLKRALQREVMRILAAEEERWDFNTLESALRSLKEGEATASPPPGLWRWLIAGAKIVFYNEAFPLKDFLRSRLVMRSAGERGEGYSDGGRGWLDWVRGEKVTFRQFARKGSYEIVFFTSGMRFKTVNGGEKKIGDLFTDAKLPVFLRKAVPMLASGESVAFLPGWRISDQAALQLQDEVLEISLSLPAAKPWDKELFNALKRGETEW